MTELQKAIINKVNRLSNDDAQLLMVIIDRLLLDSDIHEQRIDQKLRAFNELQASVERLKEYFPPDFAPEAEYREAMALKYGK